MGHLGGDLLARSAPDGYPKRIWNKQTGEIDKSVAEQWKKYDLLQHPEDELDHARPEAGEQDQRLRRRHGQLLPQHGVENLNDFLSKADNPKWTGEIVFQRRAPHCWGPRGADLLKKMTAQVDKYAPAGADLKSWKYR